MECCSWIGKLSSPPNNWKSGVSERMVTLEGEGEGEECAEMEEATVTGDEEPEGLWMLMWGGRGTLCGMLVV